MSRMLEQEKIISDIRQKYLKGEKISSLASEYGLSISQTSRVCSGESFYCPIYSATIKKRKSNLENEVACLIALFRKNSGHERSSYREIGEDLADLVGRSTPFSACWTRQQTMSRKNQILEGLAKAYASKRDKQ